MMDIQDVYQTMRQSLSDAVFDKNSVYGVLLILMLLGIFVIFFRKVTKMIGYGVGLLFLWQVLHIVAFHSLLGKWFPQMQLWFKFEPFVALSQLCVDTWLGDALLWLQAFLDVAFTRFFVVITWLIMYATRYFGIV